MSIDLEAIEARVKAASEGPWYEEGWFTEDEDGDYVEIEPADAVFISHAREDIPALLAEVKRQAAEIAAVTAERDAAIKDINLLEDCGVCKHHDCDSCDLAGTECHFEWRGPQAEKGEAK